MWSCQSFLYPSYYIYQQKIPHPKVKQSFFFFIQFAPSTRWQAGIGTAWGTWWSLWWTRSRALPPSSSSSCSPSSSPPCSGCRFSGANLTRRAGQTLTGSCPARWRFSRYPPRRWVFPRRKLLWKSHFLNCVRHAWAVSTNKRARASYYLSDTKMLPTDTTFFFATNLCPPTTTSSLLFTTELYFLVCTTYLSQMQWTTPSTYS